MGRLENVAAASAALAFGVWTSASADPTAAEADADHALAFMFGEWVGEASGVGPDRKPFQLTQTERVGPMLGGDVVVIEGKGYTPEGGVAFNAFAVVSPAPDGENWEIRSYAQGLAGTFPFALNDNGYVWTTPAGPNAQMRYTATFDGDRWTEIGEYVAEGQPPVKTFTMSLTRTGSTDWPATGSVDPQL